MSEFKAWNQFGWRGISFLKPADWELGKIEGDENKGYIRLDNHLMGRVEMRWKGPRRIIAPEDILVKHLRDLKRKAGGAGFKLLHKKSYQNKALRGLYFIWESDVKAVNIIVQCGKCMRVVLLRVMGNKTEPIEDKADALFRSLKDHVSGERMLWSVFGFNFAVPPQLRLNNYTFLSGHIKFDFSHGGNAFFYDRLSPANIILKEKNLSRWVRDFCGSRCRRVELGAGYPREGGMEEALYITGREYGKARFLKTRFFKGLFWHCKTSNRIFGVAELVKNKDISYLDDLVSGVRCHGG